MRLLILFVVLILAGCAKPAVVLPVDETPYESPKEVAQITDGNSIFVYAIDDQPVERRYTESVQWEVRTGQHVIWAFSPSFLSQWSISWLLPKCYKIDADLKSGVIYRLMLSKDDKEAFLVIEETNEVIAQGHLVESNNQFGCDAVLDR